MPNIYLDKTTVKELSRRICNRFEAHLSEMKPNYDDSIVGFNEAWDIIRDVLTKALEQ